MASRRRRDPDLPGDVDRPRHGTDRCERPRAPVRFPFKPLDQRLGRWAALQNRDTADQHDRMIVVDPVVLSAHHRCHIRASAPCRGPHPWGIPQPPDPPAPIRRDFALPWRVCRNKLPALRRADRLLRVPRRRSLAVSRSGTVARMICCRTTRKAGTTWARSSRCQKVEKAWLAAPQVNCIFVRINMLFDIGDGAFIGISLEVDPRTGILFQIVSVRSRCC